MDRQFQSSPLSQEGRYSISWEIVLRAACFNPRPSRKRGATTGVDTTANQVRMFQSSPLSQEGRYLHQIAAAGLAAVFQSSPLSQEGRYRPVCGHSSIEILFQSSPLSQEGRYLARYNNMIE